MFACLTLSVEVDRISGRRKHCRMAALHRFLTDRPHGDTVAIHPAHRVKDHLLADAHFRAAAQLNSNILAVVIRERGWRLDNLIYPNDKRAIVYGHILHRRALQLSNRSLKNEGRRLNWTRFSLTCRHARLLKIPPDTPRL